MEHLLNIIKSRRPPGILIIDFYCRPLYSNKEMQALMPFISGDEQLNGAIAEIPPEVLHLCQRIKHHMGQELIPPAEDSGPFCALIAGGAEQQLFSIRALLIHGHDGHDTACIMLLAEKVAETHQIDFTKIRRIYSLSGREVEVVKQICTGLPNRAIADRLYISEHTVKDHLKSIMKKMMVSSRNEVIAALKA